METYEQITLDQWVQWKEDIRRKLAETAQNFVYIGFRLKQIRDSGMFGGAADIFEFAEREYGLGKSTVSRFIAINERYSEGGNSLELKKEFRAFSSSKLSEMLTLPDNEIQLITEKTTIREIRELKEFNRQEVRPEEEEGQQETCRNRDLSLIEKCISDFFKDKEEMLNGIMGFLEEEPPKYREAMEQMNPSGQSSHRKGLVFMFFYDWNTGVKYKLMGQPEPDSLTWTELFAHILRIYRFCDRTNVWKAFYQDGASCFPVATSQQEDMENSEAGTIKENPETEEEPVAAVMEEQLPGQMNVHDYPEMIPEERKEEKLEADDVPKPDEINGVTENDGCTEDSGSVGDQEEEKTWRDVIFELEAVKRNVLLCNHDYPALKTEQLRDLYRAAINMAAAVEEILIRSEKNEQKHHA